MDNHYEYSATLREIPEGKQQWDTLTVLGELAANLEQI
jgi:hypothetical protein